MADKSNFTPEQLAELQKYFRQLDGHFEITSGNKTKGHGRAEYCLTTDTAQGIHIYEEGYMKIGSNKSMEIATGFDADDKTGMFSIRCKNGNIVIKAYNGDLVLEGNNIHVNATGPKGYVSVNGTKNVEISSASVSLSGDNTQITGTMSASVLGGFVTTHGQNGNTSTEGVEEILDGSLIQKIIGAIEQVKMFFKSICG